MPKQPSLIEKRKTAEQCKAGEKQLLFQKPPRFNGLLGLGLCDGTLKYPSAGIFGLLSASGMLSCRALGVKARPSAGGLRNGPAAGI